MTEVNEGESKGGLEIIPERGEVLPSHNDESDDSDVVLSNDDFEDIGDDDLFSENVDVGITERVIKSLGGSKLILVEYHRGDGEDEEEDNVEEEGDHFQPDDDLNDSDCEDEPQLGSENEGGPEYPIFQPRSRL